MPVSNEFINDCGSVDFNEFLGEIFKSSRFKKIKRPSK
jgi:hypothetical protein